MLALTAVVPSAAIGVVIWVVSVLPACSCQTEGGLGFLDLRIDGAHVAREIAGVQRQRDHQFAQGFSHRSSPTFHCGFGLIVI